MKKGFSQQITEVHPEIYYDTERLAYRAVVKLVQIDSTKYHMYYTVTRVHEIGLFDKVWDAQAALTKFREVGGSP